MSIVCHYFITKHTISLFIDETKDTWIFPLLQMGEFGIIQDEEVTTKVLSAAPKDSFIQLATGYFNLTDDYARTLITDCKANISLLMAHPNVCSLLLFYSTVS